MSLNWIQLEDRWGNLIMWYEVTGEKYWEYYVYESTPSFPPCWWVGRKRTREWCIANGPTPRHTRSNQMIRQTTSLDEAMLIAEIWERDAEPVVSQQD